MSSPRSSDRRIRVGIIGLSAAAVASWAADAHLPALLSSQGRKHFTIAALCNSSVSAARKAIQHYDLPSSVKAYGTPDDLAKDPEIDLVICATRVDKHYDGIVPSIKAGKDVYVEWPIASTSQQVREIARLAQEYRVRIAVGLQGRFAPPVLKVKEVLEKSEIGQVLSSDLHIAGGTTADPRTLGTGWEYFAHKKVGGNNITILYGHAIDQVQSVLGTYIRGSTQVHTQIQYPTVHVMSRTDIQDMIQSDVPDQINVTGTLSPSPLISEATRAPTLTSTYRSQYPFSGRPTLSWNIYGTRGALNLSVHTYPSLQADAYSKPVTIEIQRYDDTPEEVETIPWTWSDEQLDIPVRARGTFQCLVAFAEGRSEGWVSIQDGCIELSEQLETWIDGNSW